MCNKRILSSCILTLLCVVLWGNPPAAAELPVGTAFTYQGELQQAGLLVDDPADGCFFTFSLWDGDNDPDPGVQIGQTLMQTVEVAAGRFTATLDFGADIFTGSARWLEIAVCCPAPCVSPTTLSPRQELTPAPYSLHAPSAESVPWSGLTGVPTGFADDIDNDTLEGLSCAGGQLAKWDGAAWQCAEDIDTDTTYDGTDFALSNQSCAPGDVVSGVDAAGTVICAADDAGGSASTLDEAYDGGGAGAGRTITADAGAVNILGPDGLTVAGTITSGSSITIDGTAGGEKVISSAALELHTSQGRTLRLEPNATSPNLIGGFSANSVTTGVVGATISGGGQSGSTNRVTDDFGTIGGGRANQAGDNAGTTFNRSFATVGGGRNNTASGLLATVGGGSINAASGQLATVGGGQSNTASGFRATVGGGQSNTASGRFSTVPGGLSNAAAGDYSFGGGGRDNIATGNYATIPGGDCNTAGGAYCFAAGRDCNASHLGSFVWADHNTTDLTTTGIDQFLVQASGGVKIFSDPNVTVGVQLFPSGNSWSSISDRALKENLTRVDPGEVLQKLARVPVTQWNLKSQDPSIQHIGPMAQDFHAVFGVGESDRHISSSDADGVALAAIQGLYEMVKEKDAEIAALRAEMDDRIAALEKKLTELTATEER